LLDLQRVGLETIDREGFKTNTFFLLMYRSRARTCRYRPKPVPVVRPHP